MIQRILGALSRLSPRFFLLAMLSILGAAALEGWFLVLQKPFLEYRQLSATKASLTAMVAALASQQAEQSRLTAELKELSDRLSGELRAPAPEDQLAVSFMSELDRDAARKGVMLLRRRRAGQISAALRVAAGFRAHPRADRHRHGLHHEVGR